MLPPLAYFVLAAVLFFVSQKIFKSTPKRFPPGPRGIPFVGNLFQFSRNPLKALSLWKEQYPRIMGCTLGEFRVVVLNDVDLMKTAFSNSAFNGRPPFLPAILFSGGKLHGTLTSDGSLWKTVRNATIKNLSRLGFGSSSHLNESGSVVQEELAVLTQTLRNTKGRPTELKNQFYFPIANYVWSILSGSPIPSGQRHYVTQAFTKLHNALWYHIASPVWMMSALINSVQPSALKDISEAVEPFHSVINDEIESSLDQGKYNFFTSFIQELEKEQKDAQVTSSQLKGTVMNLYQTAGESVSNILNWAIMYLSLYPEVQKKLALEIMTNSQNGETEQSSYTYTKAFIEEVLRISSTSPFANFHYTICDVELEGYFIPKGTLVIGNLYGIHHNPLVWEEPEIFRPERFLSEERKNIKNFVPFSLGSRACIGQSFAKNFIFTSLVKLVTDFDFKWDPSVPQLSRDEIINESHVSIFRFPPKHRVCVMERKRCSIS